MLRFHEFKFDKIQDRQRAGSEGNSESVIIHDTVMTCCLNNMHKEYIIDLLIWKSQQDALLASVIKS